MAELINDPSLHAPIKVALLVMGVGRSGTSALTRVLNFLGAALPPETLGAGRGNERGHWEPLSILALNEEILAVNGSDWYDPHSFPKAWFTGSEAAVFIERATAIIENDYGGAPFIVIKEPRICRLAPIYLAALNRIGYASRVVIPLRHPSEVIGSLKLRDDADELTSELIWIRHILETEAATRRCPRVWTTYDELLEDWRSVQARIASTLDIAWPQPAQTVAPEINAFLAPALRHFNASEAPAPRELGPITSSIWQTLQAGLVGDEATLREGFDKIRAIIDEIDRLSASQVAEKRTQKVVFDRLHKSAAECLGAREAAETALTVERRTREEAETALTIERRALEEAETAVTIEQQAREAAEAHAAILERQARENREEASAVAARAAAHSRQLETELAEHRQRIADIYESSSWRLTAPLRSAIYLFRSEPRTGDDVTGEHQGGAALDMARTLYSRIRQIFR
jgi:hypothetical protein